jgi:hypothetical protein
MSRRHTKPFAREHRPIAPSGRPPERGILTWREEHALYKAQQLLTVPKVQKLRVEVEAYIGRLRRANNNDDDLKEFAQTLVARDDVKNVIAAIVFDGQKITIEPKRDAKYQLKHAIARLFTEFKIEVEANDIPPMPRGLRAFIKQMGRD